MRLPAGDLVDRALWLVSLRWIACAGIIAAAFTGASVLNVLANPRPLYAIVALMLAYNTWFRVHLGRRGRPGKSVARNILLQMVLDQLALSLLLYHSGSAHNPFSFYFVFHMILASLLISGPTPYYLAGLASALMGGLLLGQLKGWLPCFELRFAHIAAPGNPHLHDPVYLLCLFVAFTTTLFVTVYFITSVRRYVDRVHAEVRQKEKMLGIGQLVAGIAHQISNPLDGVQNCLHTIAKGVAGDKQLATYTDMMKEALDRIERIATRVQSFARPRGLDVRNTNVNAAVEAACKILEDGVARGIEIRTSLARVPLVRGDLHSLQEVLFNLCTNAIAAMPDGGLLALRTRRAGRDQIEWGDAVAVEIEDTGVGIPATDLEKVFEPFYTTRADAAGTGLGLGLCRMLISEMGGSLEVDSTEGEGTTFRILLTAIPGAGLPAPTKEDEAHYESIGC